MSDFVQEFESVIDDNEAMALLNVDVVVDEAASRSVRKRWYAKHLTSRQR